MVSERRSGAPSRAGTATRTFTLTQRIRYAYDRPITDLRQQLRTVPPTVHGSQRRRRWDVRVEGAEAGICTTVDTFGNVVVEATVPRVADAVDFVVDVEVDVAERPGPHRVLADPRYLHPTALSRPDAAIRALAAGTDDVAELCHRVRAGLDYEWGVTGVATPAAAALAGGKGVCQDYAHILLAACRHAGVAARYVSGHLPGEGGSHAWVEVLRPDRRRPGTWIVEGWDPTHDRRTNDDYLTVAVGRDYLDAAPMTGTYEGDGATGWLTVTKDLARHDTGAAVS